MAQEQAVKTIQVQITDRGIEPPTITIPPNYPIKFEVRNTCQHPHRFAIPSADYRTDEIAPGQTANVVWTFVNVGQFEIVASAQPGQAHGPRGQLVVQAAY